MTFRLFPAVVFSVAVGWTSLSSGADDDVTRAGQTFFENKIRPVLVKRCFPCHAGEKREGKLRLDRRDFLIQGGQSGRVVQPGEPNASVLIRAIRRVDKDLKMPPADEDQLTADEIQDFVTWIKLGVPFPGGAVSDPASAPVLDLAKARQFWSLRPLLELTPPQPERAAHDRIDEFVRAKLQAAGMQPSAPADKQSLLRRATYDLTGLPPTPAEIDAFVADTSTKAFANVVERLLDSPQYGVHWARHWFDVARYGDTRWVGAGEDRRWPFAYTYRDWVIESLNEDMPYDRFVTLQLAADQVPDARQADQAALGFLTVGRWFTGTLPDVIDDQIDVVTRGLLGVSAQCARCHDHKYDPISTQDYYSLYGLFAAAQMPVDGTGVLAKLPEVRSRPVDAATEQEVAALRGRVDEFLNTRLTDLRNRFRTPDKMRQYMTAAEGLLPKMDNDVRAFAKSQELDERILQRWVRYLRNTTKNPHPIFAPWHALAVLPEADFESQATAAIENAIAAVGKERGGKFNTHVAEGLTPAPKSLAELTQRYVNLFTKYDVAETSSDPDAELLRQVMRSNDSPVQVSMNELGQFLSLEEHAELVQRRRTILAKLVALPEKEDHYLTFQHDAAPLLKDVHEFLDQRRISVAADVHSPEKLAAYLLAAREAETTSDGKLKSLAKSRQLSERQLRRWMEYLKQPPRQTDPVFATWLAFAAVTSEDFANQAAQLTEQAKRAGGNRAVAMAFETSPASLSEVAKRCAELIVRCQQSEPFPDADHEAVRQLTQSAVFPLRREPDDLLDFFTQKDFDGLRDKERNLLRLYLESPGSSPRAMVLRDSSHTYAQRVFVRGNPNQQGEPSHGGFITVLAPDEARPFTPGRGRAELAQSIVDRRNPLNESQNWQSAFLPGIHQGTFVNSKHEDVERLIENIRNRRVGPTEQRAQLDLLARLNRLHQQPRADEGRLESRIQSFEQAFRMQVEATDAFDLTREPKSVFDMYGPGPQARQLILTRRLLERGVRVVQAWYGAGFPWDHHGEIEERLPKICAEVDRPTAAFLRDLKQRGLLDDTLVLWGGEFGRTPTSELPHPTTTPGRDHNRHGFTVWMAGGGIKGGHVHGATDDAGFAAVKDPVHVHDLHATILHLLGLDHEHLTYRYAGRDFRLTDVHGKIVRGILA